MADTYEKDLGQKSSLTTSDYIRVVGSDNASYKQLVSDVAKKIIENYTNSSLAGANQSVKSALDTLNSKLITNAYQDVDYSFSGITGTFRVNKRGRIIQASLLIGNDNLFSNATGNDMIAVLPEDYRPAASVYFVAMARDVGNWANANYFPVFILVEPNGSITIRATSTVIKQCRYLVGSFVFSVN